MTVSNLLDAWPVLVVILGVVMRVGLAWQGSLTWPEYRTAHGVKRWVFPILADRAPLGFDGWVNGKGGRDDAEFLFTLDDSVRNVTKRLTDAGGSLHLIASVKRRPPTHGDPLSTSHVVYLHDDGDQTEAYLFRNTDGSTDVYVHHEPSPARPLAHLGGDEQSDGDPKGVVADALAE